MHGAARLVHLMRQPAIAVEVERWIGEDNESMNQKPIRLEELIEHYQD